MMRNFDIGSLALTHGPSGITGRADEVLPQVCRWLHINRPEQLCFAEGIFRNPALNRPCLVRKDVNPASYEVMERMLAGEQMAEEGLPTE